MLARDMRGLRTIAVVRVVTQSEADIDTE